MRPFCSPDWRRVLREALLSANANAPRPGEVWRTESFYTPSRGEAEAATVPTDPTRPALATN